MGVSFRAKFLDSSPSSVGWLKTPTPTWGLGCKAALPFPPTPHSLLCAAGIRRRRMEEKHFLELVLCWIKICIFIYRIVYIHFWPSLHVYKFIIKALARCPWRIRTSWGGRPATCVETPCCQGCMRPWRIGARVVASPLLTLLHLWTRGLLLFFPEFTWPSTVWMSSKMEWLQVAVVITAAHWWCCRARKDRMKTPRKPSSLMKGRCYTAVHTVLTVNSVSFATISVGCTFRSYIGFSNVARPFVFSCPAKPLNGTFGLLCL